MKRYTLLEVVQEAARAIGADEMDSLDESIEALDLAGIAVATLNDIISRQEWEFLSDRMVTLTPTNGFIFTLPDDVLEVLEVYVTSGAEKDVPVPYAMPQYFVRRAALNASGTAVTIPQTGVLTLSPTGIATRYTSFDETSLVLLNHDPLNTVRARVRVTLDMTGAGNKLLGYQDDWVPEIPLRMFNYWVYETCAVASATLRQTVDQRMEGMAQRAYESVLRSPAVTRLESQQRKLSRLMDARLQAMEQGAQQAQAQRNGGSQQ